jgi:hypothetical protein
VGSSSGLHALPRSQLNTLFAIAGLAAGCVASSASPGSVGGRTPQLTPAGSSQPATPSSSPELEIVPWVDRSAPAFVDPSPRPYPADARPCCPADLSIRVGDIGAGLGNINLPVEFVNSSGSTCLLDGYPTIGGLSSDGTLMALSASHGSYFGDPGPAANIGPREVAALNISGADACSAALSGEHRSYPRLRIGLPGGGSVDVRAGVFDTVCGVWVSRFGVPADEEPVPVPSVSPLTAQISAPTTPSAKIE